MSNKKTILGFIAGASIGAIAGILLAPDAGPATRKKIIDTSSDLTNAVKDRVTGLFGKLQKSVDEEMPRKQQAKSGEEKIRNVMHHAKEGLS